MAIMAENRRASLFCGILIASVVIAQAAPTCPFHTTSTRTSHSLAHLSPTVQRAAKTLYVQPQGSLAQRLAAIASGLTIAKNRGYNAVIVWTIDATGVDKEWSDLFQDPSLPLTDTLPKGCPLHTVDSHDDLNNLSWSSNTLCVASSGVFTKHFDDIKWFYEMLYPSAPIESVIKGFMEFQYYDIWGQWIGVHMCYDAPDCMNNKTTTNVSSFIQIAKQLKEMPVDGETVPRFFIVSDNKEHQLAMQQELWTWNMTGIKGAAITYPDLYKGHQLLTGVDQEVLNLWLLSRSNLIIGTKGSLFSEAAHAMGKSFQLTAA